MGFGIDCQCPQCGAPAVLDEADRLFVCAFCRVRSYLTFRGAPRYRLPPVETGNDVRPGDEDSPLIYVPYWRYRGVAYFAQGVSIGQRIVDASFPAVRGLGAPFSLGLRPQAMRLRFASAGGADSPDTPDIFLKPDPELIQIFRQAGLLRKAIGAHALPEDAGEVAFSGDGASLIYAPFRMRDRQVQDAVLNVPVSQGYRMAERLEAVLADPARLDRVPPAPQFIPTLCPACGWDMQGERASRVLTCANCASAWTPKGGSLTRVACAHLPDAGGASSDGLQYLPFWFIRAEVPELELRTYADFVRTANLPLVARPGWADAPFVFAVPAFRIQPTLYLRLSRQFTSARPWPELSEGLPASDGPSGGTLYPVTLTAGEVLGCLKMFLAECVAVKRTIFPRLAEMAVYHAEPVLTWLPFVRQGADWTQEHAGVAVNGVSLEWGKTI